MFLSLRVCYHFNVGKHFTKRHPVIMIWINSLTWFETQLNNSSFQDIKDCDLGV